jgi:hypothetical protein
MSKDDIKTGGVRLWGGAISDTERPQPKEKSWLQSPAPDPQDRSYTAFDIGTVGEYIPRLHIRCAANPSHYPTYSTLLDIIVDEAFKSGFTLIYSFMTVEVTGQNLAPIVHAISYGQCERIREFHSKLYDRPPKDATLIEAITVTIAGGK